jgi:hypothetical protein
VASGRPAGKAKHVSRYLSWRALIALHQVVLGVFAFEVPRPPAGAVQLAVRRGRLAPTNPLLQHGERSVQAHDGDDRAGYCLRDPLQLRSTLDEPGEKQPPGPTAAKRDQSTARFW